MGRHALPDDTQQTILELAASGVGQRAIARELGMSRIRIENVLFPGRLKKRREKKLCARLVKMDRKELPEGCFDVTRKVDWLTG